MMAVKAAITSVGGYVPEYRLTNQILESMVDTNDEWITSRTGIKERRILKEEGAGTSFMAIKAIEELLEKRGIEGSEIDLVICSTTTPDMPVASTAAYIATKIGAENAFSFDLQSACSGFLYGLVTGSQFIETGKHKKVIVVGGDKMSSIIDYSDRTTCVIFGDGAGAVLLEPSEEFGVQDSILKSDGNGREFLYIKSGGSMRPPTHETVENKEHFVHQEGQQVFKFAVTNMANVSAKIMERNGLVSDDIAYLVPHQANKRIIDATANRMGIGPDKVMLNIHRYGNTTNGTLPLCLWDYEKELKKGDNLIFSAFGGGFTWGSVYLKWAYNPS
ncbi:MAG: beta-ketoacyl-ACP synthase III [Owenweeksia sp.]